jgi:CHAT domain-containing protein
MGDVSDGHEVVSFPRAFLSAGAGAVIAPLWVVEDEATSLLMTGFYSALASEFLPGGLPAHSHFVTALANTQRQFIRNSSETRSKNHPFYWAGFYLTGSPS